MANNQPKNDDIHLNTRQISQENKKIVALYEQWENRFSIKRSITLLEKIAFCFCECRYVLNRGTVPSNPKKQLAPKTEQMLYNYMTNWSKINVEIKSIMKERIKIKLLRYGFTRRGYKEITEESISTSTNQIRNPSSTIKQVDRVSNRGFSRDFYQKRYSSK